ncbi:substrate-binding domain-containing protein [Thiomicrorhabdus sp.]|uniref:substrate-binding domain-containing protein n=1 Tax=Thiomicrorhabdus sp. TaxID=2039724 RepID=UPI0029C934F2|nr:substrate-binding domain-containing protein [Thiomicrorhabdus sp.]
MSSLFALCISAFILCSPVRADDILLLCNLNSASPITLSSQQLKRIYTMKTRVWSDGTPITVFTLQTSDPVHKLFTQKLLKTNIYQLDRIWNRLTFSGQGRPPIILDTEEEMLANLKETPGAIGYLSGEIDSSKDLHPIQIREP